MVEVTHKARDVAKSIFAHEEFDTACHQLTSFYQSGILEGRRQMREEAAAVIQRDVAFSLKVRLIAAIHAIPIGDE